MNANLSQIDSTARPAPSVPASAVVAYRMSAPWVDGTREARKWWHAVDRVLEQRYCGDTLAAHLDGAMPSVCLDLHGAGNSWLALYPASTSKEEIAAALAAITEESGVDPVLVERYDLTAGPWGDDVTQVVVIV